MSRYHAPSQTAPRQASSANRDTSSTHTQRNRISHGQGSRGNLRVAEQLQRLTGEKRRQYVRQLALDPGLAHQELDKLFRAGGKSEMEGLKLAFEIAEEMQRRFSAQFAFDFLVALGKRTGHRTINYWPPGTGPTPERLRELGNVLAATEQAGGLNVDIYLHATGTIHRMDRGDSTSLFGTANVQADNRSDNHMEAPVTPVPDKMPADEVELVDIPDVSKLNYFELAELELTVLTQLTNLDDANLELEQLCVPAAGRFSGSAAESAQRQFRDSHRMLEAAFAGGYKNAQASREMNKAVTRNERLRRLCCSIARNSAVALDHDLFGC
jgi:hypothetical protein